MSADDLKNGILLPVPSVILDPTSTAQQLSVADPMAELQREIRRRRALEEELAAVRAELDAARRMALHDAVTGLPNRTLFLERLEHALRQARRHAWTIAVLFIDLDDFKAINDTHGHETGDAVLKAVADCLQGAVRGEDTVCRYGGDEFACLLLNVMSTNDVLRFANGLERRLSSACEATAEVSGVNASIGIAVHPDHGSTADAMLRHADAAMYSAKGTATRVRFYEPECDDC